MPKTQRPKIRKFSIKIPTAFVELNKDFNAELFIPFVISGNPKYYKVISLKIADTEDYSFKKLHLKLEKLQNLKSLITKKCI